jgi:hypothetical protein
MEPAELMTGLDERSAFDGRPAADLIADWP